METEKHLTELRGRLIFSIISFLLCFALCFFFTPSLIKKAQTLAPQESQFFQIRPGELFFVYLKVTFYSSLLVSFPLFAQQISQFIWPALKKKEKTFSLLILALSPFLFIIGVLFAYFVAIPPVIKFLFGFGVENNLTSPQYSLEQFLDLVISLFLIFGLTFQLPVLVFSLALLGLVSSEFLLKNLKVTLFSCFFLGAVLTPTQDPLNMLIFSFLLILLYFVSLLLIKLCKK